MSVYQVLWMIFECFTGRPQCTASTVDDYDDK